MTANEVVERIAAVPSPTVPPEPETLALEGGHGVRIRPASPEDAGSSRGMFSRLSRESIYLRFHAPYPRVPEWAVASFLDVRDGEALVAVAGGEVIGHAMSVRSEDGREAEVAVVVEDAWQSRGIGKLLLSRLAAETGERGVEVFFCEALGGNRRVLGLVRAVFVEVGYTIRGGSYLIHAPLRALKPAEEIGRRRTATPVPARKGDGPS